MFQANTLSILVNDWESGDGISVDHAKEELEEARFGCWGQGLDSGMWPRIAASDVCELSPII